MKFLKLLLIGLLVLLALDGCSSKGGTESGENEYGLMDEGTGGTGGPRISRYGQPDSERYGTGGSGSYDGTGAGRYGAAGGSGNLDDPSSPLARRVIYFEYDSDEVQPQFRSIVSAHAHYLASHPDRNVVLEGHADERGSPEYNIALGEQRALRLREGFIRGACAKKVSTSTGFSS